MWRRNNNGVLFTVLPVIFDPLLVKVFRLDGLYTNWDNTKYSIKKITTYSEQDGTEEYFNYSEGIKNKFPGYDLDSNSIVMNVSD